MMTGLSESLLNFMAIVLITTGVLTPTIDYTFKKRLSSRIILLALIITLALSFTLLYSTFNSDPAFIYDASLKVDIYGAFLTLIAVGGTLMILVASMKEIGRWSTAPSFYSLISLTLLGVCYMIFLNDILLLFAAWTLVSVASYALIGIRKDEDSLEGATKYALMGVMATAFMLYGIALLFGLTGSTRIFDIAQQVALLKNEPLILMAFILLIASFSFKIGVVPFHGWLPDVYGGVHPLLVSFMAGVVKIAGIAALLRLIYPLAGALSDIWLGIFAALSIMTMSFGNIAALVQRNVQRMMAYSSIAQGGYILLGFAAATGSAYVYGLQGIALHIATYTLAKIGIFVALAYLLRRGIKLNLDDLSGLGRKMPITCVSVTILILSLIGVPPLLGFWSKFPYLFLSTITSAPWLTLMAILNSAISVGYYIQVIRYMFFMEGQAEGLERARDPELAIVIVTTIFTVLLGLGLAPIIASALSLS